MTKKSSIYNIYIALLSFKFYQIKQVKQLYRSMVDSKADLNEDVVLKREGENNQLSAVSN